MERTLGLLSMRQPGIHPQHRRRFLSATHADAPMNAGQAAQQERFAVANAATSH
jgi:hypothetical protein